MMGLKTLLYDACWTTWQQSSEQYGWLSHPKHNVRYKIHSFPVFIPIICSVYQFSYTLQSSQTVDLLQPQVLYMDVGKDLVPLFCVYCWMAHSFAFFSQLLGRIVFRLPFTPYLIRSTASIRSSISTTCRMHTSSRTPLWGLQRQCILLRMKLAKTKNNLQRRR